MGAKPPVFSDRPPAKINLTLEVIGRRPDGYHELRSIFLRVGLSDQLSIALGGADGADSLTVTGLPGAPVRHNLVSQALDAVRGRTDISLPTLEASLDKQIPAAAGLGGGSSDAASAIKLAQACWGVGLSEAEELALALEIGSDVPFFLSGATTALVEGRGEHVSHLSGIDGDLGILLVKPPISLATAAVFDTHDELDAVPDDRQVDALVSRMAHGWSAESLLRFSSESHFVNDLWDAASTMQPVLIELRAELEARTRRAWMMSGSGPTLFAFYSSAEEAVLEGGAALVARSHSFLNDCQLFAVDLIGPDPAWRYP